MIYPIYLQYFHFYSTRNTFLHFHHVFVSVFLYTSTTINWNHKKVFQWTFIKATYIRRIYNHFFSFGRRHYIFYLLYPCPFLVKNLISVANVCSDKIFLIRLTQFMSLLSYIIDRHQSFEEDLWLFIPTLKSLNTSSEMQSLNIYW